MSGSGEIPGRGEAPGNRSSSRDPAVSACPAPASSPGIDAGEERTSPISGSGARSGSGASSGSGAKPGSVPNSGSAKTPPLSGDSSSRERAEGACVPSAGVPRTSSLLMRRFYHTRVERGRGFSAFVSRGLAPCEQCALRRRQARTLEFRRRSGRSACRRRPR